MKQTLLWMAVGVYLAVLAGAAGVDAAATAPARAPAAGQVLLLMDVRPFALDNTSVEDLLRDAGLLYDVAGSAEMATVDLSPYPAVIVVGSQFNNFYDAYRANAGRFDAYVEAGGCLEFHAGGWYGDFDGIVLPGGITIHSSYSAWNWINDLAHPLVTGVGNPFNPNSRAAFSGSLPGLEAIVSQGDAPGGLPTTIEYTWGAGRVIAFGQPLEYLYTNAYSGWQLLPNAIDYLAGQGTPNVYVSPGQPAGYGVAGQEVPYTFTIINGTGATDTFNLALSGADWPAALSAAQTGSLAPNITETVMLTVTVPLTAQPGDLETMELRVSSALSPTLYHNGALIRTTATSGDYGFVMGIYHDKILRIDRQLNVIAGYIQPPPFSQPRQGAFSPSGDRLYVSLGASRQLAVIDPFHNTIENLIDVGTGPRGVAVTPDGSYVLVANYISDNLSIINTATQAVSATLSTGNESTSVAAHPCQPLAYVAARFDGSVSVVDTTALTVTAVIPGLAQPSDLAVSPYGQFVYVAESVRDQVAVIDTSLNEVVYRWPAGNSATYVDVSSDGRLLYVADSSDAVIVMDALSGEILDTIRLNLYYSGITDLVVAPADYGPFAYVAAEGEYEVLTIDTQSNTLVGALDIGTRPEGMAYFPAPHSCLAGILLTPGEQYAYGEAGQVVDFALRVSNASAETRTIDLSLAGAEWPAALSASNTGALGPWETFAFTVTVQFPAGAGVGDQDSLTVEAASDDLAASAEVLAAVPRLGYVLEADESRVALVDTILHHPTGEYIQFPASSWAWRGVLSEDFKTLYAVLRDTNQVAVIDLTMPYTYTLIPVGTKPYEISLSPDGEWAFVANHDDDSLSVIDTAALTVTQVITGLPEGPISIETSPCLDKIYVASKEGNAVTVLDGATFSVTAVITAGLEQPWGMAASPLGDRVYVSSVNNMDVVVIDTASDTMAYTWTINLPGSPNLGSLANLEVSPDGLTLYAADPQLGLLYVVDTQTGEVTDEIPVSAGPDSGTAWDVAVFPWPDEGIVYVSVPYHYLVRAVDVDSGQTIGTMILSGGPRGLALFPDAATCGTPPAGSFTQSAATVRVGETVLFTATITGVPAPALTWNFGDGSPASSDAITSHAYAQEGVYTVTLSIGNPLGHLALTSIVTVENLRVYLPLALRR